MPRTKKKERIIEIFPSNTATKKYGVLVRDIKTGRERTINFGAKGYEQFKDSTKLKLYSHKDHGDPQRRRNYFNRHSGIPTKGKALDLEWKKSRGYYNAKILSHQYLW